MTHAAGPQQLHSEHTGNCLRRHFAGPDFRFSSKEDMGTFTKVMHVIMRQQHAREPRQKRLRAVRTHTDRHFQPRPGPPSCLTHIVMHRSITPLIPNSECICNDDRTVDLNCLRCSLPMNLPATNLSKCDHNQQSETCSYEVVSKYSYILSLCTFDGEVTWPVCSEDKDIGWSDIFSNQPPVYNLANTHTRTHRHHEYTHVILCLLSHDSFTRTPDNWTLICFHKEHLSSDLLSNQCVSLTVCTCLRVCGHLHQQKPSRHTVSRSFWLVSFQTQSPVCTFAAECCASEL